MTENRSVKEPKREGARDPRPREETRRAEASEGGKSQRKPSKIERREWRGAGVCGDRHTD